MWLSWWNWLSTKFKKIQSGSKTDNTLVDTNFAFLERCAQFVKDTLVIEKVQETKTGFELVLVIGGNGLPETRLTQNVQASTSQTWRDW